MRSFLNRVAGLSLVVAILALGTPAAYGDLLLNYQFETVDGTAPNQTTPDSTGTYTSSSTAPLVNALVGFGTSTPGTDYPLQIAGSVANATVKSLNPGNYMNFYSTVTSSGTQNNYTRVEIDDTQSGALDVAFTNFSVALWLFPTDNTTDRWAIGKIGIGGNRGWQILGKNGTAEMELGYYATTENDTDRAFVLSNVLPLDTWTHVAFAFDGTAGTEAIYINGVAQTLTNVGVLTSVPTTLNSANSFPLRVGHRGRTGATIGGWKGGIDDVRIYNHTLTAADVQGLMAPVTPPHAGDFDGDGDVDGADFVAWQTNFPTATGATLAQGDADGDGDVDGADFVVWQTNFPFTPSPGTSPVPEPHAIGLLVAGVVLFGARRFFGR
jgi:hypothetical protein